MNPQSNQKPHLRLFASPRHIMSPLWGRHETVSSAALVTAAPANVGLE